MATHHAYSSTMRLLDAVLRGVGQVMLQNNRYTGIVFLVGIALNSTVQALGVLFGALVSTWVAVALNLDKKDINAGLYGFNGSLVGLAISIFLAPNGLTLLTLILAAALSTIVTLALNRGLAVWSIPAFTAPFVLISWTLFLSHARFGRLISTDLLPTAGLPQSSLVEGVVSGSTVLNGLFNGISQVFFQEYWLTGLIFLIALAINQWRSAVFAVLGSLSGVLVAWLWGASELAIQSGAFGFNGVLVAIALGVMLDRSRSFYWGLIILALLSTPFVYAALSAALEPIGMPTLTLPFVLVVWLFMLAAHLLANDKSVYSN